MDVFGVAVPLPVIVAFVLFAAHVLLISDVGAGAPIFFPIAKRFMQPFKPTPAYERLKSKYVI